MARGRKTKQNQTLVEERSHQNHHHSSCFNKFKIFKNLKNRSDRAELESSVLRQVKLLQQNISR